MSTKDGQVRLGVTSILKPLFYAVLLLGVLVCALEVGLRVHDSIALRATHPETQGDGLVVPSWTVHHELKPLRQVEFVNPDDGSTATIRTNSFGLRGPEPAIPKPEGLFRILCLGDETILGPDVPEGETAAARLETLLAGRSREPLEVLNGGVPGDCPLLSHLRLRHTLAALQPDVVVVHFDMGDVADDYRLRRHTEIADGVVPVACPHPALRRMEKLEAAGKGRFLLPLWIEQQITDWTRSGARESSNRSIDSPRGRFAWLQEDRPDWDVYVRQGFSSFDHLRELCVALDCALVVAAYPAPWQVSDRACCVNLRQSLGVGEADFYRGREPFDRLGDYLAERGIAYCDGSEAFRGSDRPETLFLVNAPRFAPAGHDLHARVLATYLLSRVNGPWNEPPRPPTATPTPRVAPTEPTRIGFGTETAQPGVQEFRFGGDGGPSR